MTLSDGKKTPYQADSGSNEEQAALLEVTDAPGPPPYSGETSAIQYRTLTSDPTSELESPSASRAHEDIEELPAPVTFPRRKGLRVHRILQLSTLAVFLAILCWIMSAEWNQDGDAFSDFPHRRPRPPPDQGDPGHEATWTDPVPKADFDRPSSLPWYSSTANFSLPLSADALFIHALGHNYDGHLYVVADNTASAKSKTMEIGIEAVFHRTGMRDSILVSDMTRGTARGVGVYGCEEDCPSTDEIYDLVVYIHVRLPPKAKLPAMELETEKLSMSWKADKDGQLTVPFLLVKSKVGSFTSDYLQVTGALTLQMAVGSVKSGHVIAPHIVADTLDLATQTGEVSLGAVDIATTATLRSKKGSFDIKELSAAEVAIAAKMGSIDIRSLSAAIAKLQTEVGSVRGLYEISENLLLNATTGSIDVDVAVPRSEIPGPKVTHVQVLSTNGSIKVKYTSQDPSVELHSLLQTVTGSCTLTHHPSYEGSFALSSKIGSTTWSLGDEGKKIVASVDEKTWTGRFVEGKVWRPGSGAPQGSSVVKTVMGSVIAVL